MKIKIRLVPQKTRENKKDGLETKKWLSCWVQKLSFSFFFSDFLGNQTDKEEKLTMEKKENWPRSLPLCRETTICTEESFKWVSFESNPWLYFFLLCIKFKFFLKDEYSDFGICICRYDYLLTVSED